MNTYQVKFGTVDADGTTYYPPWYVTTVHSTTYVGALLEGLKHIHSFEYDTMPGCCIFVECLQRGTEHTA